MVYLEFSEYQVYLKDEAGHILWEHAPPGMWRCHYCGTYVCKSESLCIFCGGGRKPEGFKIPTDWNRLSRRGVLTFSYWKIAHLRGARVPLPDGTKIYGSGVEPDFFRDRVLIRVMHPDLYQVDEGCQIPFVAPVYEETDTGALRFVSWYAND